MQNEKAIKSLRTFALTHNEPAFADMCTAALQGELWAIKQVESAIAHVQSQMPIHDDMDDRDLWRVIRSADTTRPDGDVTLYCGPRLHTRL